MIGVLVYAPLTQNDNRLEHSEKGGRFCWCDVLFNIFTIEGINVIISSLILIIQW